MLPCKELVLRRGVKRERVALALDDLLRLLIGEAIHHGLHRRIEAASPPHACSDPSSIAVRAPSAGQPRASRFQC